MDGMLSQEEINALLGGADAAADLSAGADAGTSGETLTDAEKDAVGEISNICMGTAATTLSTLLNTKVNITIPQVSYTTMEELSSFYDRPCIFVRINYIAGLNGNNILILKESDVKIIADLMMGGDGTNVADDLSELHLSAISEAMNQMMGSASTSLSSMLDRKVDISPPSANLIDFNESFDDDGISEVLGQQFVRVSFRMEIGDLIDSQIMQLYPFDFVRELYNKFSNGSDLVPPSAGQAESSTNSIPEQNVSAAAPPPDMMGGAQQPMMGQPMMDAMQQPMMGQPMMGQPMMGAQQPMMQMPYGMPMGNVNVQPAQFQSFAGNMGPAMPQQENINLIMDVPLEVTVELGRTNKSIKEILDFSPGTIIELDKLAGEPIDILVNGKFVAKGEVVVIEESFGIRVTEIIK